uniref:G-box binding factor homolog n=1 Tax=Schistosoma mansoni TaxID=6183 RepID=O96663_SCHMA|nr:G-box binding factor homolog [Schistosoma mansoni]
MMAAVAAANYAASQLAYYGSSGNITSGVDQHHQHQHHQHSHLQQQQPQQHHHPNPQQLLPQQLNSTHHTDWFNKNSSSNSQSNTLRSVSSAWSSLYRNECDPVDIGRSDMNTSYTSSLQFDNHNRSNNNNNNITSQFHVNHNTSSSASWVGNRLGCHNNQQQQHHHTQQQLQQQQPNYFASHRLLPNITELGNITNYTNNRDLLNDTSSNVQKN